MKGRSIVELLSGIPLTILGVEHQIQGEMGVSDNANRAEYRQLLAKLLVQQGIDIVGEEYHTRRVSFAQQMCVERNITYINVDIPAEVQDRIFHTPAQQLNEATGQYETCLENDRYALAWNLVREYHMHQAFIRQIGTSASALLICGGAHVRNIQALFLQNYPSVFSTTALRCFPKRLSHILGIEVLNH